jgi:hypothetical protein
MLVSVSVSLHTLLKSPYMHGESGIAIFRRLIESAPSGLSPGAVEAILGLRFPQSDQVRVEELATKSNQGVLTSVEAEEYDGYIAAADLLSLWKSKARLSLKQQSTAV